jgi:predicted metalloprotease with PDZ domain
MKRLFILICTVCWLTVCAQGSESPTYEMHYTVTPDTASHYLNVRLDYEMKEAGNAELVLNMPRWAPGYYQILDFAKHLCDFSASDGAGRGLTWRKDGMNRWRISLTDSRRRRSTAWRSG